MVRLGCWLLLLLVWQTPLHAASPDPLRFYPPGQTNVVLKIEKPKELIETLLNHPAAQKAQELALVKQFLDSADLRKFFQLLAYYERDLGAKWPALLDQLAGGGLTVGLNKLGDNAPALFVMQGTNEKTTSKFLEAAIAAVEDEIQRQGGKEGLLRRKYEGIEAIELSKDAYIARIGSALLLANKSDALKAAIDQHVVNTKDANAKNLANSDLTAPARALLPKNPLAWLWVNLKPLKETPEGKDLFAMPRNEIVLTLGFAGWLDVARRSDFIAAGLYHQAGDWELTVRMPAGRDGLSTDAEIHVPRNAKVGGTLPPLQPKGMLFSHSFYFDADTFYQKRAAILPAQSAKDLEEGEKQISRFLLGSTLPKFLAAMGPHHRVVAAQPETVDRYKTQPGQRLPTFAYVVNMRDPSFARTMSSIIRAGMIAVNEQVKTRSWDEEIAGVPVFGYSFAEGVNVPDDPQNLRFNYQPCAATVGHCYIVASNKGFMKELIELVKQEKPDAVQAPNLQTRGSARGLGDFLNVAPDQTLAATILQQGLGLGDAKQQAEALLKYLQSLGTVEAETIYNPKDFALNLRWKLAK